MRTTALPYPDALTPPGGVGAVVVPATRPPVEAPSGYCFLARSGSWHCVKLKRVYYVEMFSKYCVLTTAEGQFCSNLPVAGLLVALGRARYVQVHRRFFVNLQHLQKLLPGRTQVLVAGTALPLGRAYRAALLGRVPCLG